MKTSTKAQDIFDQINNKTTKLGDLRVIAKEIKMDHELAMGALVNRSVFSPSFGYPDYGQKTSLTRTN